MGRYHSRIEAYTDDTGKRMTEQGEQTGLEQDEKWRDMRVGNAVNCIYAHDVKENEPAGDNKSVLQEETQLDEHDV